LFHVKQRFVHSKHAEIAVLWLRVLDLDGCKD